MEASGLEELFQAVPLALARLMVHGPRGGSPAWRPFQATGADQAELLVALLSEVVYLWDAEARLVVAVRVEELTPTRLTARLGLIPADPARHQPGEPVKAVTYHQARVEPRGGSWRGQVILDV